MNSTIQEKTVANLTRQLKGALTQLATLSAAILTPPKAAEVSRAVRSTAAKTAKRAKQGSVPAHLMTLAHKAGYNAPHHLTETQKADILTLLTKTDVPVLTIAKMFGVTGPTIYGLRDKHKLAVRRGSEALIAGVKAAHRQTAVTIPAPVTDGVAA